MDKIYVGLDLDETLIVTERYYALNDRPDNAELYFNCDPFKYALHIRDGVRDFLNYIDDNFELFFYTRATKDYAEHIVNHLGYGDKPLFHREDTIRVEIPAFGYDKQRLIYQKKDLFKIAEKLGTKIDKIVFIDDVSNDDEIIPTKCVIAIPEMVIDEPDNDLLIILQHFKDGVKMDASIDYFRSLQFI